MIVKGVFSPVCIVYFESFLYYIRSPFHEEGPMNMTALCRSLDAMLGEMWGLHPLLRDKISYPASGQHEFVAKRVYGIGGGKFTNYILSFGFFENGIDVGSIWIEILSYSSARVHFTVTSITDTVPAVSKLLKRVFSEGEVSTLSINKVTLLSRIPGRFSRDKEVVVDLQPTAHITNGVSEVLRVFDRVVHVLSAPRTLHIPERK